MQFLHDLQWTSSAIGFATFTMVTLGMMLGRALRLMVEKRSEVVGVFILI